MSSILFYLRMVTWMFLFIVVMSLLLGCKNFSFKADVKGTRDDQNVIEDVQVREDTLIAVEEPLAPLQLSDVF